MEQCAQNQAANHKAPMDALLRSLKRQGSHIEYHQLRPLPDTGLAHWHVRLPCLRNIDGSARHIAAHRETHACGRTSAQRDDWVARIPKQSQMQLDAEHNLAYQAACFARAQAGGHTPRLHGCLPCDDLLPRGALLVEAIDGRSADLPNDLPAMTEALASLHRLPLPTASQPLDCPLDPWQDMQREIRHQAEYLHAAGLSPHSLQAIERALRTLPERLEHSRDATRLISFDAHPGNFLIERTGRAVLVDLEKCRYSLPGFDLAHMSLYTSTTWDINTRAILFTEDIVALYQRWQDRMGPDRHVQSWRDLIACRQAMWLWSVTWCAKWKATQQRMADSTHHGEDWSSQLSDDALIQHVRNRVDHYLSLPILQRVMRELRELADAA
ncbi:phosphotransferase [Halomonas cupida]|uniref:phosphotransferase n=1 Tax=Halomonas cupida TaxID=44933 RepID=UPI003A925AD2